MRSHKVVRIVLLLAFLASMVPETTLACAACFGKSDSPMAQGMNMGIFALLGVVFFVLSGFLALIIFLARRGAAFAATQAVQFSETTNQS